MLVGKKDRSVTSWNGAEGRTPRDEQERRYAVKRSWNANWERREVGCFGEGYFPDGRSRLLRYTSGRNLPLLFKETFFPPPAGATASVLDFPGHLLDKHSPSSLAPPPRSLHPRVPRFHGFISKQRGYASLHDAVANSPRIRISRYERLFARCSLLGMCTRFTENGGVFKQGRG